MNRLNIIKLLNILELEIDLNILTKVMIDVSLHELSSKVKYPNTYLNY